MLVFDSLGFARYFCFCDSQASFFSLFLMFLHGPSEENEERTCEIWKKSYTANHPRHFFFLIPRSLLGTKTKETTCLAGGGDDLI